MSINTQKSRERIKRSTLTGVVPTVPVSSDFTDGTWLNTDIRAGEFFYNIPDEKLWIGTNTVPLELTSSIGNTLAQILTNGNTTGASDISVDSGQVIKSSVGNSYLSLEDPTTSGSILGSGISTYIQIKPTSLKLQGPSATVFDFTASSYFFRTLNPATDGYYIFETGVDLDVNTGDYFSIWSTDDVATGTGKYGAIQLGAATSPDQVIIKAFDAATLTATSIYKTDTTGVQSEIYTYVSDNVIGSGARSSIKQIVTGGTPTLVLSTQDYVNNIFNNISLGNGVDLDANDGTSFSDITINPQYIRLGLNSTSTTGIGLGINNSAGISRLDFQIGNNLSSSYSTSPAVGLGGGAAIFINARNSTIGSGISLSTIISSINSSITGGTTSTIIGSQNSTIAAGVYNSAIIGGNDNQILGGQGNIISGSNNNNIGSGSIISGSHNTMNGSSSIMSGGYNTITSGISNLIIGNSNINILGSNNIIGGDSNNNSGNNNILSGQSNLNTSGSGNIISGSGNEIYVSDSLLIGANNIMTNPGIMYGNSGVNRLGSGFSNTFASTINATPTLSTTDGTNSFKIDIDTAFRVELTLLAKNINTGDAKEWKGFGIIKNVGGTTSLVGGTLTMTSTIGDVSLATATVAVTANNTTDTLDITVTGIAATDLAWNCSIQYVLVNV